MFQSLSQALLQLRADMVETAQESAKAHASEQEQQINVQALVDKETKKIKVSWTYISCMTLVTGPQTDTFNVDQNLLYVLSLFL